MIFHRNVNNQERFFFFRNFKFIYDEKNLVVSNFVNKIIYVFIKDFRRKRYYVYKYIKYYKRQYSTGIQNLINSFLSEPPKIVNNLPILLITIK